MTSSVAASIALRSVTSTLKRSAARSKTATSRATRCEPAHDRAAELAGAAGDDGDATFE